MTDKRVTNKQLLKKLNIIHDDIKKMDIENKKSIGINLVAVALAFIAITIPIMIRLTNPAPIFLWPIIFVYFGFGVIILYVAYKISQKYKK